MIELVPTDSDAYLVAQTRAGDVAAFEQLVARHRAALIAVATTRLGTLADAEDVAQEAFVRAFFKLEELRNPEALLPWLKRMTERLALMRVRSRREEALDPENLDRLRHSPEEETAEVEALLSQLSPAMRQVLVLTTLAGYTTAEVAQRLGVSEGTIKSRLSRARAKLRSLMTGSEEGEMGTQSSEEFTKRTIARLKKEARQLLAEGKTEEVEKRVWAIYTEQVKAFLGGREPETMAERMAVAWNPEFHLDAEALAMFGVTQTFQRRREFAANAAMYGYTLDELDWTPEDVSRWSGTIVKPTGHGKDTWGVPRSKLPLTTLDARELCQRLRCSPVTLWEWVKQGLPVIRCWPWARYDVDRVQQWLAENGITEWPTENAYMLAKPNRVLFCEVYEGRLSAREAEQVIQDLGTLVWDEPLPFKGGWDDGRA